MIRIENISKIYLKYKTGKFIIHIPKLDIRFCIDAHPYSWNGIVNLFHSLNLAKYKILMIDELYIDHPFFNYLKTGCKVELLYYTNRGGNILSLKPADEYPYYHSIWLNNRFINFITREDKYYLIRDIMKCFDNDIIFETHKMWEKDTRPEMYLHQLYEYIDEHNIKVNYIDDPIIIKINEDYGSN